MPQGKCSFCGTFVTGGGTPMGRHSVACTACTPLALKWIEKRRPQEAASADAAGDRGGEEKQPS